MTPPSPNRSPSPVPSVAYTSASSLPILSGRLNRRSTAPAFADVWPAIDAVVGSLSPGQERWLFNAARRLDDDAVVVEVGPDPGRSTTAMAFACRGSHRRIFAVGSFKGVDDDRLETFNATLEANDFQDCVTAVQGPSYVVGTTWKEPIDFLFIHGAEDIPQVFEDFYPWLKPGGLVAVHDILPGRRGPYRAWQDDIRHRLEAPSSFFSIAYGRKPRDLSKTPPKIHVIIPVHARASMTRACLKELAAQSIVKQLSVTVVDDGSLDNTRKMLANEFPGVGVIEGDGELFWTGAAAKAVDELRSGFAPGDFFLMINNDARLSPETVEKLVATSELHGRVGIAPIAISDGQAISTGWAPSSSSILNNFERQFDAMASGGNAIEVKALFGRCSLFPVEILDLPNVENYDAAGFRHYYGDTDFCLRAGDNGFRFFVTGATCIQIVVDSRTTGSHHDFRQGPQPWSAVWRNLTSVKSVDNIAVTWRFMSRHHRGHRVFNTLDTAWKSLRYWKPIYKSLGLRPIGLRGDHQGSGKFARSRHYAKRTIYYLFHPISAFRKAISLVL